MLDRSELEDLKANRFRLEMLSLELKSRGTPPTTHVGAGELRQDADGRLRLSLYLPGAPFPEHQFEPAAPGIVAESEYWTLSGRDFRGRSWHSSRVLPEFDWSGPGAGSIARATVRSVEHSELGPVSAGASSHLEMHFFTDLSLPSNAQTRTFVNKAGEELQSFHLNIFKLDACGLGVAIESLPSHVVVTVRQQSPALPVHLASRMRETLQFVSGRELTAAITTERNGQATRHTISPGPSPFAAASQLPFLANNFVDSPAHYCALFAKYLEYVLGNQSAFPDPLSLEWNAVVRSDLAALETQALILAVSAEALAKLAHSREHTGRAPEDQSLTLAVVQLRRHLEEASYPDSFRKRVDRFLNSIGAPRAIDLLYDLAKEGAIDEALIPTWKTVRHRSAHGVRSESVSMDSLFNERNAVLSLLYQLAFRIVGYEGPFTDYATATHGRRAYPFSTEGD